ncbi:MAG: hypothetical protein E6J91_06600 [Deltaproteobacteria bacterium]|nr:MAG: hypothetical protein E6J91_06600 [Deltaproteobacteria bacterium]
MPSSQRFPWPPAMRRGALATTAALCVIAPAVAAADDVQPFAVALPAVTGPIPSTPDNFGFAVEGFDVQPPVPPGYVIEEFFVSGTGDLHEFTPTGIRVVSPCPPAATSGCTSIPYTTRMIVKRPRDAHDFSGTVIIEPLNPSGGFDIAAVWDRSEELFVRNGDIFIGWSSKSVIINALKRWNPTRYAPLSWDYRPFVPGGNSGANDGITFDIAAQIGALIKSGAPGSPLHGLRVRRVIESGFSQDGGFTFTQADIYGDQRTEQHQLRPHPGRRAARHRSAPAHAAARGAGDPHRHRDRDLPRHAQPDRPSVPPPRRRRRRRSLPHLGGARRRPHLERLPGIGEPDRARRRPDPEARDRRRPADRLRPPAVRQRRDPRRAGRDLARELPVLLRAERRVRPPRGLDRDRRGAAARHPDPDRHHHRAAAHRARRAGQRARRRAHAVRRRADHHVRAGRRRRARHRVLGVLPRLQSLYRNHGDYVHQFAQQSIGAVRDGFWLLPDAIQAIERAARSRVP